MDLKIDEGKLLNAIEKAETQAKERLDARVNESKEEVKIVARALRDTPDSTLELFKAAAVAFVEEIEINENYGSIDVSAEIRVGPRTFVIGRTHNNSWAEKLTNGVNGRYRALLFLVKLST